MTRRPKSLSLGKFGRQAPAMDELDTILAEINGQSDRAAAIVAAIHLESALEEAIAHTLTNVDEDELFFGDAAPMGSFSAKIKMAHALGVISKGARRDMDAIRVVRNQFAHARRPINFDTKEIAQACKLIELVDRVEITDPLPSMEDWPPVEPRAVYCEACGMYATALKVYVFGWQDTVVGKEYFALIAS